MYLAVMLLALLCLITGLVLRFVSYSQRKAGVSLVSMWNPRTWIPWNMHEWYTPKGLKLHHLSYLLIVIGVALYLMAEGAPSFFPH